MVETHLGVQAPDPPAEERLDTVEVLVGLLQLLAGVAEDILHLRYPVAHEQRQGGAVFAAGKT